MLVQEKEMSVSQSRGVLVRWVYVSTMKQARCSDDQVNVSQSRCVSVRWVYVSETKTSILSSGLTAEKQQPQDATRQERHDDGKIRLISIQSQSSIMTLEQKNMMQCDECQM